jgi:hypothetical protein
MEIGQRVKNLQHNERDIVPIIVTVMKEMKWSYQDTLSMPIPAFLMISKELEKMNKKQKEAAKRGRR